MCNATNIYTMRIGTDKTSIPTYRDTRHINFYYMCNTTNIYTTRIGTDTPSYINYKLLFSKHMLCIYTDRIGNTYEEQRIYTVRIGNTNVTHPYRPYGDHDIYGYQYLQNNQHARAIPRWEGNACQGRAAASAEGPARGATTTTNAYPTFYRPECPSPLCT